MKISNTKFTLIIDVSHPDRIIRVQIQDSQAAQFMNCPYKLSRCNKCIEQDDPLQMECLTRITWQGR